MVCIVTLLVKVFQQAKTRGSLVLQLPANEPVQKVIVQNTSEQPGTSKKRKYTTTFAEEDRATIGKFAEQHGNARAVNHFKGKFDLSESTVRYFKQRYLQELGKRARAGDTSDVTTLPTAKRGRKLLLGESLDKEIQQYIKRLRDSSTGISSSIVLAAAEGYIMQRNKTVLVQYGGHVELTRDWALSLLTQLGFVKRRATTKANKQLSEEKFQEVKRSYLNQIASMVHIQHPCRACDQS